MQPPILYAVAHISMFVCDHAIEAYLQYLCNAFAFYKISRYDIKEKKYFASSNKHYLSDHVFRYAKPEIKSMDYGRML